MLNKDIYNSACQYLARREHGYKELTVKLTKKFKEQVSKQEIFDVLDHLVHKNYLSEQRACEMYVMNQTKKLYGPNRIHQHLYSKGFEAQTISDTITASNIDLIFIRYSIYWSNLDNKFSYTKLI